MGTKKTITNNSGFTIVEISIVIIVMGLLALLVFNNIRGSHERAYRSRADSEMLTMANAVQLYAEKNNHFPEEDPDRNIPASIKEFISANNDVDGWPNAPWPGSVYDYDGWDVRPGDGDAWDTIQISVRFCPQTGPGNLSDCQIPKETWSQGFVRRSSFYYCIKGYCRPHLLEPTTTKGYCVNCPGNAAIKYPGES